MKINVFKAYLKILPFLLGISLCIAQNGPKKVFHYVNMGGYPHPSGVTGVRNALATLQSKYGFYLKESKNSQDLANLSEYDLVVFDNNQTANKAVKDENKAHVEAFVEGGGKWLGYHAAGDHHASDAGQEWDWYLRMFDGSQFLNHGRGTFTLVQDEDVKNDPELNAMWEDGYLGNAVTFTTEFYRFQFMFNNKTVRGQPGTKVIQVATGNKGLYEDHIFTWTKKIGKGRMLYTALGHQEDDCTQNEGWLSGATWYYMKYLMGDYAPCCGTLGNDEYEPGCKNHQDSMCVTTTVLPVTLNPSSVEITSEKISVAYSKQYRVKILNVNGEIVMTESNTGPYDYSLSNLVPGLYFVEVSSIDGAVSQRVIVM